MVRQIEDDNSEHDTHGGAYDMARVAPQVFIKCIEDVPDPAPDKHEPDSYRHILSYVFNRMFLKFGGH